MRNKYNLTFEVCESEIEGRFGFSVKVSLNVELANSLQVVEHFLFVDGATAISVQHCEDLLEARVVNLFLV